MDIVIEQLYDEVTDIDYEYVLVEGEESSEEWLYFDYEVGFDYSDMIF